MKYKEYKEKYLDDLDDVTFIITKAVRDNYSTNYHAEYKTTQTYLAKEWLQGDKYKEMNILNDNQPPIIWLSNTQSNTKPLHSLLIISDDDIEKICGKKQAKNILNTCEKEIKKEKKNG